MRYNITAATGNLGSKIVEEVLKHIAPEKLTLTVRNPHKAAQFQQQGIQIRQANYRSEQELASAFKDTDVLIYIPSLTFPSVSRIMEFENAMIAAEKMNVKQFLFIGFMADQGNNPFKMSPFLAMSNAVSLPELCLTHIYAMACIPIPCRLTCLNWQDGERSFIQWRMSGYRSFQEKTFQLPLSRLP